MKRHKRSKVITYFLSFIPGIGFMYRGYMKRGFSYLTVFLLMVSILDWLGIGLLSVIPILFWVYAFFDQINSFSGTEEEQLEIEDLQIWNRYIEKMDLQVVRQNQKVIGSVLVILGGYLLMKGIYCSLISLLPYIIQSKLMTALEYAPQILVAVIVLYGGTRCLTNTEIMDKLLDKLTSLLPRFKKKEQMLSKSNVVYYMEKGENMEEKSEKEILESTNREQLLSKAEDLLHNEIYQSIQIEKASEIEAATTLEEAPKIEPVSVVEKALSIEKVEVEKCPHSF